MIASMALPSFAGSVSSGEGTGSGELVYSSDTANPVVTVTMPPSSNSGDIILNPYGMSVTVSGGSTKTDQIISATRFIENKTPAPMKVGVTATAITSGDVEMSSNPCTGRETEKVAYMILEFKNATAKTEPDATDWNLRIESGDVVSGGTVNQKLYPQIIPTAEGTEAPGILSVPAASSASPNYIAVKVFGNLASAPEEAWKSTDQASVKLEFTFTPAVTHQAKVSGTNVKVASTIDTNYATTPAKAIMGTYVRVEASNEKTPVVKDANDEDVSVEKAFEDNDKLYFFTMPATDVTVKAGG